MKHLETAVTKRLKGTDTHSRILKCAALARKRVGKKQLLWGDCGQWAWAVVQYLDEPELKLGLISGIDRRAKTINDLAHGDPDIWHVFLDFKGRLFDGTGETDMDAIFGLMDGYEDPENIQEWLDLKPDEPLRRLISSDTNWKNEWPFYHKLFADALI